MHCTHTFIWNMDNKTTVCFYDPCQLLLRRPRSLIMIVLFIGHLKLAAHIFRRYISAVQCSAVQSRLAVC